MSRIDRIAEPWATRTPYGPGETWPTGSHRRTILPVGRRGPAAAAVRGEGPLTPSGLAGEPGVRPQL